MLRRMFSTSAAALADATAASKPRSIIVPVGVNRVTLLGRCSDPPKEYAMPNSEGRFVTTFKLSTSEKRITDGQEDTYINAYHKVVTFDQGAHRFVMETLKPGMSIYVEGRLVNDKYTDADGNTRYYTSVNASSPHGRIVLVNDRIPKGFEQHDDAKLSSSSPSAPSRQSHSERSSSTSSPVGGHDGSRHQGIREYPM